jgi:hypothetical protein
MILAKSYSPALSLAVACKALGNDMQYRKFADLEQEAVDIRWTNDGFKNLQSLHVQPVNEERAKLGLTPIRGG